MQKTFNYLLIFTFLFCFIYSASFSQEADSISSKFPLKKKYFLHSFDSVKTLIPVQIINEINFAKQTPDRLNKQGMILRGISLSTNTDLTINSAFRLDLSGKLSDNIDVIASLTDQNTPIQPQGNTQSLREIDNVFISIKSPSFKTTFGDLYYSNTIADGISINRKVQGGIFEYQEQSDKTKVVGIVAANRGLFHSNIITPIEGVQGPYKLYGKNNSKYIIVIAGSEKIYLDGAIIKRGEQNDYIIDYSTGEIIFTSKKLITNYSRIVIDFEYSERNYFRSLYGIGFESSLSNNLNINTSYHREEDDVNSTTDFILTDEDKVLLSTSNDSLIGKSGIYIVGIDSLTGLGKGDYVKIDTLIEKKNFTYYLFLQRSKESIFTIRFTFLGKLQGDYDKISSLEYRFVGIKKGSYLPIILIPKPSKNEIISIQSKYKLNETSDLSVSYQGTRFNENTFGNPNGIEGGNILFNGKTENNNLGIGKYELGKISFLFSGKYKGKNFAEIDRTEDPDYSRKWNLLQEKSNSTSNEISVFYFPIESLKVGIQKGLNRFTSDKFGDYSNYSFNFNKSSIAQITFNRNSINAQERNSFLKSEREDLLLKKEYEYFIPSLLFQHEKNRITQFGNDSLNLGSYYFHKYTPEINIKLSANTTTTISHEYQLDNRSQKGIFEKYSTNNRSQLNLIYSNQHNRFELNSSYRTLNYENNFENHPSDQKLLFYRVQSRVKPVLGIDLDFYGENTQQQGAKYEKRFIEVQRGEGKYRWIDGNKNGSIDFDDERDFEPTRFDGNFNLLILPTENYETINSSKFSWKSKFSLNELLPVLNMAESILKKYSYDLLLRVERKGNNTSLSNYFTSPSLTTRNVLHSNLFAQQQFYFQENNREFNLRYRHLYREGLTSFLGTNEIAFLNEHTVRAQVQLIKEIGFSFEFLKKSDRTIYLILNDKNRMINLQNIISDISYRPEQDIEVGIKMEFGEGIDNLIVNNKTEGITNLQSLRIVSKLFNSGQLRFEFTREEGTINSNVNNYLNDFHLLQGKQIGKTYLLNISADTRLESNLIFSLYYIGRYNSTYSNSTIHTAKMEMRLLF